MKCGAVMKKIRVIVLVALVFTCSCTVNRVRDFDRFLEYDLQSPVRLDYLPLFDCGFDRICIPYFTVKKQKRTMEELLIRECSLCGTSIALKRQRCRFDSDYSHYVESFDQ